MVLRRDAVGRCGEGLVQRRAAGALSRALSRERVNTGASFSFNP